MTRRRGRAPPSCGRSAPRRGAGWPPARVASSTAPLPVHRAVRRGRASLLGAGVLPVADGELVARRPGLGVPGHRCVARLVDRPRRGRRRRLVVVPLAAARRGRPAVRRHRRRRRARSCCSARCSRWSPPRAGAASSLAALGTAAVLLAARSADSAAPAAGRLPRRLLLGPLAVGLGGLGGQRDHPPARRPGGPRSTGCEARARRAAGAGADPRRRARPGHPHARRPRADHDQRHRRRHRAVDHRHRPRRRHPRLEPRRGEDARPAARRRRPQAVDRGVPPARGARGGGRGRRDPPPGWPRSCTPPRSTAATSATGPTWPPTAQQRTVSVAITPRTDDQGAHAGWNFVGTDMTEARATERMKDQFVSLISHELRTPLTSILGYLELVLDDEDQPLTDEQRSYLTHGRAQRRPAAAPGRRPAVHRAGRGRPLHPRSPRTSTWPPWCAPPRRPSASPPRPPAWRSSSTCPTSGLVVPGDAVRLGQACDNLVSNAVKFTPAGGRVTLSLRAAWQTAGRRDRAPTSARTPPRSPSWRSATPASASPPASRASCSPASSAPRPRSATPSPAWGSAWPSPRPSPPRTAARSTWSAPRARAPPSR